MLITANHPESFIERYGIRSRIQNYPYLWYYRLNH